MESKNLVGAVLNYVGLSLVIIVISAFYFYQLSSMCDGDFFICDKDTIQKDGRPVKDEWDLRYYSFQVYYSGVGVDMSAHGWSRGLYAVEIVASYVIHVLIIGSIIGNILDTRRDHNIKKTKR